MPDTDKIVIDTENMQVDRSTPLGQSFAKMQEKADKEANPAMNKFMNSLLAYSEACLVVDETVPDPQKKAEALDKLKNKFENV